MTETLQRKTEEDPPAAPTPRASIVPRRVRLAEALACVGLLAAFVAALGPAERVRTEFSWPPPAVTAKAPGDLWFTPLLLSARIPESISVRLPCTHSPTLTEPSGQATAFATVRRPASSRGLVISQGTSTLNVRVGDSQLARVPIAGREGNASCSYVVHLEDGRWSVDGGPAHVALSGDLGFMPEVNALISQLDLRERGLLQTTLTTKPHDTDASARQTLARAIAAIAALLAFVLIAFGSVGIRPRGVRTTLARPFRALRWMDGVVVLVLVGWWILAPAHWDDGWVAARQSSFASVGGFSNYYDSFAANLPNGYWLEWLQHWVNQSSTSMLVLRLPALLALLATWGITRWALARILGDSSKSAVVSWAAAASFLAGALAWGMTLRPEPFTVLLVTLAFACAVAFSLRESSAALAVAVALIPLAATAHHAGLLAAAPLLAVGPQLLAWIRKNPAAATALATAAFALLLLLAFMGADVAQRSLEAQALRSYGVPDEWFDELRRYARLSDFHGGPVIRRGAVAVIALTVLAFVVRRRRQTDALLNFPTRALLIGLLLLLAVPSKWPWHFGVLMGIAAVAAASETFRIRSDDARPRGWQARWLLAVGAITIAIAWSWGPRQAWTLFDLNTLAWTDVSVSLRLAAALPLILLVALLVASRLRSRPASDAPWRVTSWAAPIVVVPMILFTVAFLITDATRSEWTLARQNAASLRGHEGCGLADAIRIPRNESMRPVRALAATAARTTTPAWLPPAPRAGLERFPLDSRASGSASSPWFGSQATDRVGVYLTGYRSRGDKLQVEWGAVRGGRVDPLGAGRITADPAALTAGISPWLFLSSGDLPPAPAEANALRFTLISDSAASSPLAVSTPVTYRDRALGEPLTRPGTTALVSPAFLLYMPCAALPVLGAGIAGAPDYIVSPSGIWTQDQDLPVSYRTSPFRGIADLYDLERVSIADSDVLGPLLVWRVDSNIPNAALLRPLRRELNG